MKVSFHSNVFEFSSNLRRTGPINWLLFLSEGYRCWLYHVHHEKTVAMTFGWFFSPLVRQVKLTSSNTSWLPKLWWIYDSSTVMKIWARNLPDCGWMMAKTPAKLSLDVFWQTRHPFCGYFSYSPWLFKMETPDLREMTFSITYYSLRSANTETWLFLTISSFNNPN